MCLGIPMQIVNINGYAAHCEAKGISRQVNLFLLQHEDLAVGDLVMVHVGNAIQKICKEDAQLIWETYDEMLALENKKLANDEIARSKRESDHA